MTWFLQSLRLSLIMVQKVGVSQSHLFSRGSVKLLGERPEFLFPPTFKAQKAQHSFAEHTLRLLIRSNS